MILVSMCDVILPAKERLTKLLWLRGDLESTSRILQVQRRSESSAIIIWIHCRCLIRVILTRIVLIVEVVIEVENFVQYAGAIESKSCAGERQFLRDRIEKSLLYRLRIKKKKL